MGFFSLVILTLFSIVGNYWQMLVCLFFCCISDPPKGSLSMLSSLHVMLT